MTVTMNLTKRANPKCDSGIPRATISGDATGDGVQKHHAVGGQRSVRHAGRSCRGSQTEMLECADRHDPVGRFANRSPALQQGPAWRRAVGLVEQPLDMGGLILLNVRPTTLTSYFSMARIMVAPQPQPTSKRHSRVRGEFAQRKVDLRDLRFLERHVVALEVGAAVRLGWIEEQLVELVGDVVVGFECPRNEGSGCHHYSDILQLSTFIWENLLPNVHPKAPALPER